MFVSRFLTIYCSWLASYFLKNTFFKVCHAGNLCFFLIFRHREGISFGKPPNQWVHSNHIIVLLWKRTWKDCSSSRFKLSPLLNVFIFFFPPEALFNTVELFLRSYTNFFHLFYEYTKDHRIMIWTIFWVHQLQRVKTIRITGVCNSKLPEFWTLTSFT